MGIFSSKRLQKIKRRFSIKKFAMTELERKMVLKTDKQKYKWRKLKLTAALTSRSERVSLNYEFTKQKKFLKKYIHHHLDNFISFPIDI